MTTFGSWLRGALAGATAMYFLDPDRGRRRRALARDRLARLAREAGQVVTAGGRDVQHRAHGLAARARRPMRATPEELVLIERVRSRLGRVATHPHALQVGALGGRIVLSGPILAAETATVLAAVRAVPGVRDVESHLDVHDEPGSVPSLQGGRPQHERRVNVMASPVARAVGLAGVALAALGVLRRTGTPAWVALAAAAVWASRGPDGRSGAMALHDDATARERKATPTYPAS